MQVTLHEYLIGYYEDKEIEVNGEKVIAKDYDKVSVASVIESSISPTVARKILKENGVEVKRGMKVFYEKIKPIKTRANVTDYMNIAEVID